MQSVTAGMTVGLLILAVAGCTVVKPHSDTTNKRQYEEFGPKFTEEEKAAMSIEQKVAIYNEHHPHDEQLICMKYRPTGSHHIAHKCMTRGERKVAMDDAQEFMRQTKTANWP